MTWEEHRIEELEQQNKELKQKLEKIKELNTKYSNALNMQWNNELKAILDDDFTKGESK